MAVAGNGLLVACSCLYVSVAGAQPRFDPGSMIRSDIRAHAPSAFRSLLRAERRVVFTNFEATILDERKGQSPKTADSLSRPGRSRAEDICFNLVSVANTFVDLKVPAF